MNLEELQKDLLSKLTPLKRYFGTTLLKKETITYSRRSFGDLFKYYRRKKVTEKLLLEALYKTGFSASVCDRLGQVVFYRSNKQNDRFWTYTKGGQLFGYRTERKIDPGKYTEKYLNDLFEEIINTKL